MFYPASVCLYWLRPAIIWIPTFILRSLLYTSRGVTLSSSSAPYRLLQTLTIKADTMFTVIDYGNLSKFQVSAGWFCMITFTPSHTHTDPSSSCWSKLVNQISFVSTCLDLNQQTQAVDALWMNSETRSLCPSLPSLSGSLSGSLSLYRSAVCRCAAVCNRFFSAALQPEASTGLSGRKSITAGLSLACGGAYGREIRT